MSHTKYPGPPPARDMFDFLEDAGQKIDQAGRDLAEHEAQRERLESLTEDLRAAIERGVGDPWGCDA